MSSHEYLDLWHEVHNLFLRHLKRKNSDSLRFATRETPENVLSLHYLRLFFRSLIGEKAPNGRQFNITEDQFIENFQGRELHKFLAILVFAGCRIEAARNFTEKLAALPEWPPPEKYEISRRVCLLPADRQSLTDLFDGDEATADKFYGSQALFYTVVLRQREETTIPDGDTQRLPFVEEKLLGSGSFGRVYKVKIAKGHFEDRRKNDNRERWVARKDYIVRSSSDSDVEGREEGKIMKMILSLSKTCENIMENLGTLNIEYPTGASPAPAGFIRSAIGLANGLKFLHEEMQTPSLDRIVCYNMDPKPSNVLIFRESGNGDGDEHRYVWKLSDFGMSRIKIRHHTSHEEEKDIAKWFTKRRDMQQRTMSGTQNRRGQGTYLPPESFREGKVMNTRSDVWSLGCILSGLFVYLEGGKSAIDNYETNRLKHRIPRNKFDVFKGCKVSPDGNAIAYWSDSEISLFAPSSLDADGGFLKTLGEYSLESLGSTSRFWKAVCLTNNYLVATTTGNIFNGTVADSSPQNYWHIRLPTVPEVYIMAMSTDQQNLVFVVENQEDESLSGSIFHVKIEDLIEMGSIPEGYGMEQSGRNLLSRFISLDWPAEDVMSLSLTGQNRCYAAIHPYLKQDEEYHMPICSYSLTTQDTDDVFIEPRTRWPLYPKTIENYRLLRVMVDQIDDTIFALGTKADGGCIRLLEVTRHETRDPVTVRELAQLPSVSENDEFTGTIVGDDGNKQVLVTALVGSSRHAVFRINLSGRHVTSTGPGSCT
ncbi:serine/threonine protein kinase [Colletotrichum salicis]|uniref:non-specific serine/threonine protein kinase n=1 Tax=Colletotrichum salicis TaxID=1209931 RepID=A0A135V292_9PEZI|nr:serine/threonine protein kinase [Colletotrichum salicis]